MRERNRCKDKSRMARSQIIAEVGQYVHGGSLQYSYHFCICLNSSIINVLKLKACILKVRIITLTILRLKKVMWLIIVHIIS